NRASMTPDRAMDSRFAAARRPGMTREGAMPSARNAPLVVVVLVGEVVGDGAGAGDEGGLVQKAALGEQALGGGEPLAVVGGGGAAGRIGRRAVAPDLGGECLGEGGPGEQALAVQGDDQGKGAGLPGCLEDALLAGGRQRKGV